MNLLFKKNHVKWHSVSSMFGSSISCIVMFFLLHIVVNYLHRCFSNRNKLPVILILNTDTDTNTDKDLF